MIIMSIMIGGVNSRQILKPGRGNALNFDGADDQVNVGPQFTYQKFTVEMWIKPGATQKTYTDIIDNKRVTTKHVFCILPSHNFPVMPKHIFNLSED